MKNFKKAVGFLVFMLLVLTLVSSTCYAADIQQATNVWQMKVDMTTSRLGFQMEVIDGKIYAIGGSNESNNTTNTVEVYDPSANKWTSLASMSIARIYFQTEVINGKIYAIGGSSGSSATNTVEVYDPSANKWTSLAPMSTARYHFQTEILNGNIYAIGGNSGSNAINTVEVYDPTNNKWTSLAPITTGRYLFQTEVIEGKIYAIGGYNNAILNTVEVYDPSANKWTPLAPMSIARYAFQAEVIEGKIYAIGGSNKLDTVEVYDLSANKWTSLAPMSTAREYFQTEIIDGKIYAVGGRNGINAINTVEVYDSSANKWTLLTPMSTARYLFQTGVIDGELYAVGGTSSSTESYTLSSDNLTTPINLSASAGDVKITLTWDVVYGAASYNVKRSTTAGGPYTTISSVSGSVNSYTDTGLINEMTYYYVVTAVNSNGESGNSNEASATPTTASDPSTITGNKAILVISFINGKEKEYDLAAAEIDKFVTWYDAKSDGSGKSYFTLTKRSNVKPFIGRKEYIKFENIESFEIKDYNE